MQKYYTTAIRDTDYPLSAAVYLASEVDARIAELEKVLADIASMPPEDNEWDAVEKYQQCTRMAAAAFKPSL